MLLVQEYLKTHTFAQLEQEHGVEVSVSQDGSVFSLNYSMINSKDSDPLAQQCRGLILISKIYQPLPFEIKNNRKNYDATCPQDTMVLACPFFRFFNAGQGVADKVDWSDPNLKVYSKEDGTLAIIWNNPFTNQWNMATRSVAYADLLMDNQIYTFRTLFDKVLQDRYQLNFNDFTSKLDKINTYMFELVSRYNRIVVDYPEPNIILLGARNLISMKEIPLDSPLLQKQVPHIDRVSTYNISNLEETLKWVGDQSPTQFEGVVVVDSQFRRLKVKSPAYVAVSKIRDAVSSSPRNCLSLILDGKEDDAISFLPKEMQTYLIDMKCKYRMWLTNQDLMYRKVLDKSSSILPNDKKTFALTLNQYPNAYKPAFFNIFDGKYRSMNEFVDKSKKNGVWSASFLDNILENLN